MAQRTLVNFKREDVPRELLRGPSFLRLYISTMSDWAVICACWYLMFHTPVFLYPLWGLIVAGRLHAFGVIIHDLCHLSIKKGALIRILEVSAGYIIGTSVNAMAYHHLRHHRHTLKDEDPYYNINKKCSGWKRFLLTAKKGPLFVPFWIARSFVAPFALWFLPKLRTPYARIFLQDVSGADLTSDPEVLLCLTEDIYVALFHVALLTLTLTIFPFLIYGYYFLIPAAGTLCIYRLLIEHEYDIVKDRSVYTLIESTFDHHMSWAHRVLLGPHNIGFHCMHHIHPSVGLHSLPGLQRWYLENSKPYQEKYLNPARATWKDELLGGLHKEG